MYRNTNKDNSDQSRTLNYKTNEFSMHVSHRTVTNVTKYNAYMKREGSSNED